MELPLVDPTEPPLSPEQTRFREVKVEPYPDGSRLRVHVLLTPFERRPDLEITVFNQEGEEIASSIVVQAFLPVLSLTMHLPPGAESGECSARLLLRYPELETVDERRVRFSMTEKGSRRQEADADAA